MDTPQGTPTPTPAPNSTPPSSGSGSGKKLLLILLAVFAVLALLSVVGGWIAAKAVGFGLKKALEAGGVKIDERGGTVTLGGKDGSMRFSEDGSIVFTDEQGRTSTVESEQGKLPADFTRDFPVRAGMQAQGGSVAETPEGKLHIGAWTTSESGASMIAWYLTALEGKGWTIANKSVTGDSAVILFTRGDKDNEEGGQMHVRTDGSKTIIDVLLTTKG